MEEVQYCDTYIRTYARTFVNVLVVVTNNIRQRANHNHKSCHVT